MGAPLHGAHALLPPIDAIGPPSLSIRLKKKMKTVTLYVAQSSRSRQQTVGQSVAGSDLQRRWQALRTMRDPLLDDGGTRTRGPAVAGVGLTLEGPEGVQSLHPIVRI